MKPVHQMMLLTSAAARSSSVRRGRTGARRRVRIRVRCLDALARDEVVGQAISRAAAASAKATLSASDPPNVPAPLTVLEPAPAA